ncbi:hypothetical protein RF11_09008 [Thelohanellus kitauei]|uniref:Uncharacterized protein n=1 Tax=Thelohanellus kitauei TaxID=669202 RepID=A0A0C2MMG4_THEKT|nr:hypothetical protein RF11_09008 [Thelohanellus kitauei]
MDFGQRSATSSRPPSQHANRSLRKMQSEGLVTEYNNSIKMNLFLKMAIALVFGLIYNVIQYFENLEDYLSSMYLINTLRPILDYFEENFIYRFNRTVQSVPRFPT